MKRSNTWFALILIASALLLSGVRSVNADSPSPGPTQQPNEGSTLSSHQGAQQVTPVSASNISQPTPDTGPSNNKQGDSNTATDVIAFFAAVTFLATAAIAWFNWQLVSVTADMKQATAAAAQASKDSAAAAKESASAAKAALKIDRPYLVEEGVQLKNFYPASQKPKKPVSAEFVLRNYGKGVAASPYARVRLDIVEIDLPKAAGEPLPPEERRYPILGDHSRCEHTISRERAIPQGAASSVHKITLGARAYTYNPQIAFLSDAQYAALAIDWDSLENRGPHVQIALHIVLRYLDVIGNVYTSESIWTYWPAEHADERGEFVLQQWGGG